MPTEQITFAPEIDERQLDREVGQMDDELASVGEDVPVEFDAENMDSLQGAGGGGLGGGGGGGGVGGAAAGAGIASRLPKPVSGVTAASAVPIALAGGVGLSMLSAMHNASARMQTSSTILGQAFNAVWRPIGDRVDELFIREPVLTLRDAAIGFEDHLRNGEVAVGLMTLGSGVKSAWAQAVGRQVGAVLPGQQQSVRDILGSLSVGDLFGGGAGLATAIGTKVGGAISEWAASNLPDVPDFPGWPKVGELWPGWPDIGVEWPGWPDGIDDFAGWPTTGDLLGKFPTISAASLRNAILGRGNQGGGDTNGGGPSRDGTRTGPGPGNTGIPGAPRNGGGQSTAATTAGGVEEKLDEVNRNLKRFASEATDMAVEADGETLGRVVSDAKRNAVSDTDPTV